MCSLFGNVNLGLFRELEAAAGRALYSLFICVGVAPVAIRWFALSRFLRGADDAAH